MTFLNSMVGRLTCVLLISLSVIGAALWHDTQIAGVKRSAVEAERAQLQDQTRTKLAEANARALKAETDAAITSLLNWISENERAKATALDIARARSERDSLQRTIAALRSGRGAQGETAGAIGIINAAPRLADALSECSGRYEAVAGVADQLSNQVTSLQGYITGVVDQVCRIGP